MSNRVKAKRLKMKQKNKRYILGKNTEATKSQTTH